ncbi:hypothetical protein M2392_002177 [Pseudomonas grimontii]|nr:hypothetical protein [Pseudomonas grimontii]
MANANLHNSCINNVFAMPPSPSTLRANLAAITKHAGPRASFSQFEAVCGKPRMTQWRNQSFWGKAWIYALLALFMIISDGSDLSSLGDGGSSNRKRVFSPGFIVLCVFVAVIELIALNHFYAANG